MRHSPSNRFRSAADLVGRDCLASADLAPVGAAAVDYAGLNPASRAGIAFPAAGRAAFNPVVREAQAE
jgi:hypothetical protein